MGGWDEAREADGPPSDAATATTSSRLARLAFSNASSSSSSSSSDASDTDASARAAARGRTGDTRTATSWGRRTRSVAAASPGAGAAASRALCPRPPRPRASGALRAGAGTRAARAARRDASRRVRVGRHARACGWPRTCSGGKARAPRRRRRRRRRRALPTSVGTPSAPPFWSRLSREGAANEGSSSAFDGESQDGAWDVPGFIAPMADALVGEHDWSPLETAALLEHLQAWTAEDAAALALGLSNWADAGVAALLGALMEWRRRDRAEVAHVVRALISSPPGSGGEWQGGGALGKLLGVREGEARAAAAAAKGEAAKGDGADGERAFREKRGGFDDFVAGARPAGPAGRGRGRGRRLAAAARSRPSPSSLGGNARRARRQSGTGTPRTPDDRSTTERSVGNKVAPRERTVSHFGFTLSQPP